ncbi:MAG: DUF885 domain-containing protein [Gammaproteobacteria bacterium]|nr:DUF885 domain-containing protein [Gammaproteobacteria bacterium]
MNKNVLLIALSLPLLIACGQSGTPPAETAAAKSETSQEDKSTTEAEKLHKLFAEREEEFLRLNPISATFRGDQRYNDQFPDFISEAYYNESKAFSETYLRRINEIDASLLSMQDQLSHAIFKRDREQEIESFENGLSRATNLAPLTQFFSVPNFMASLGSGQSVQPFTTVEDYDNWLKRLDGFYVWVDSAIRNMRQGMEEDIVQPRVVMEKVLPQLQAQIVDDAAMSVYYQPIVNMPEDFSAEDKERLTAAFTTAILEHLVPAHQRLHDFVRDEYIPACREEVGISAVPNGRTWYEYLARNQTTTDLSPEEIHQIGLSEVERITGEMHAVMEEVGFEGDLQAFFEFLRTDDQFYFDNKEDLMAGYEELKQIIDPKLDEIFNTLPKTDYELKVVEPFRERSMAAAFYQPGTPDGSRPGAFYVNTYDLKARPSYTMTALSLHEASPGHHFQISINQEIEGMPDFRRFGGETAYIEGWGLYAEALGADLGVYDDPYQRFGKLSFEIWRANRLVVDTGMHYKGWTREQAIEWMMKTSPITETDAIAEVERYIVIPGQALAYKIGQLKIQELRERAEQELGDAFDIGEFHDQVLMDGALPLAILETKIDTWIAANKN